MLLLHATTSTTGTSLLLSHQGLIHVIHRLWGMGFSGHFVIVNIFETFVYICVHWGLKTGPDGLHGSFSGHQQAERVPHHTLAAPIKASYAADSP